MSMGSSDKGFLIPHMNVAPKGRGEAVCVELHEGAYITHDLSLALMGEFSEFCWYLNQRAEKGREWWACPTIELSFIHLSLRVETSSTSKRRWVAVEPKAAPHTQTHPSPSHQPKSLKWGRNREELLPPSPKWDAVVSLYLPKLYSAVGRVASSSGSDESKVKG